MSRFAGGAVMSGLSGIVPILLMPFEDDGRIDFDSLEAQVDMTLAAGVHGVGIAIGSEIFKLLADERQAVLRAVVDRVGGRVPVVMNTSAAGTDVAVALAKEAQDCGADRLMIWPPGFFPLGPDSVVTHYCRIAEAVDLPVVLQDVPQSPISPALALRIAEAAPGVDAVKVETPPPVAQVDRMVRAAGDRLSVLGGAGGGTFIEEYRRGARGTMPFASQAADFMTIWAALEAGDFAAARNRMDHSVLPISRFGFQEGDLFYHVHKSILVRKGVFRTARVREPTTLMDKTTALELEEILARIPSI